MAPLQSRSPFLTALALCGFVFSGAAHPDLLDQISSLNAQLRHHGESPQLYLQRADLRRRHGEFNAALEDIAAAERLQPAALVYSLERARVLSEAGCPFESFEQVQAFLKREPSHADALIIRARCEAHLGLPEAAIADYTAGIVGSSSPGPDLLLERAKQQALLGKLAEAVGGLDEAITNGASLPSLRLAAIEYDRKRGAFDSALARADTFVAHYPVKEPWLTLRAEILEQAGRTEEAQRTFRQVLAGIEGYSPVRRGLDLTRQLEDRVRQGLLRTQAKPQTASK